MFHYSQNFVPPVLPTMGMIDRIIGWSRGSTLIATKYFPADTWFFAEHFPGKPVVPGSFLLEAMEQAAGWLIAEKFCFEKKGFPIGVERLKFRQFVKPAETLEITVKAELITDTRASVFATCEASGDLKASATLHFSLLSTQVSEGNFGDFAMGTWMQNRFQELSQ